MEDSKYYHHEHTDIDVTKNKKNYTPIIRIFFNKTKVSNYADEQMRNKQITNLNSDQSSTGNDAV
jgi:hypothetical protein